MTFDRSKELIDACAHDGTPLAPFPDAAELLRQMVSLFPMGVFWKDAQSVYRGANDAFLELVGLNHSELCGMTDWDMPLSHRAEEFIAGDQAVMDAGEPSISMVERIEYPDGRLRWLESSKYPIFDANGAVVGIVGTIFDITEKRESDAMQRRQLATIEATADAIALVEGGVVRYANGAWARMFGADSAVDCIGQRLNSFYPRREVAKAQRQILASLERTGNWRGEVIAKRRDRETFHQGLTLTRTEDGAIICVCRDISELKAARAKIEHDALHDDLTGLPNRRLLTERIELAIRDMRRYPDRRFAVLYLDLDRFKLINDSLGHAVGDQLLVDVAGRLRDNRRATDLVARLGGDEFVVLLGDVTDARHVAQLGQGIIDRLSQNATIGGREIFTGVSMGVVLAESRYHRAEDILRDADIAMYRAKRDSQSAFRFFDQAMFDQVRDRLAVETDLRRAIRANELSVHYQPIVDMASGQVRGCEALVRWEHPERGMIPPDQFIPIAEESGFIAEVDAWVMREACQQVKHWQTTLPHAGNLFVSVNLSTSELRDRQIVGLTDEVLRDTGLAGEHLCLELTERMLVEDVDQAIDTLTRLASRGVAISIDDFGTGYSSFSYLHRLPVDTLKIDRSFIGAMDTSDSSYKVARLIVTLSRELELGIVAEGVETAKQMELLLGLDCGFAQGYFFSRPLPPEAFARYAVEQAIKTVPIAKARPSSA